MISHRNLVWRRDRTETKEGAGIPPRLRGKMWLLKWVTKHVTEQSRNVFERRSSKALQVLRYEDEQEEILRSAAATKAHQSALDLLALIESRGGRVGSGDDLRHLDGEELLTYRMEWETGPEGMKSSRGDALVNWRYAAHACHVPSSRLGSL